jgi:hypothetical protein
MPRRELPRRQIEHEPQVEPEYIRKRIELEARHIENTRRWTGVRKEPVVLAREVIQQYAATFDATNAALKRLADFGGIGLGIGRTAEPWKRRAEIARGDLAGFWNDFKQEVASRYMAGGNPAAEQQQKTALDWLELAEREGGLSTWLQNWNDMHSAPWSWDTLADSIGRIKSGIEYCKEIVKDGFGDINALGQNRADLLFALDAIASEIARQADQLRTGTTRLDLGQPFDVITERIRELSPRATIELRLHDACEQANVAGTWAGDVPDAIRQHTDATGSSGRLSNTLSRWETAAEIVKDMINNEHEEQEEKDAAEALNTVCRDLVNDFTALMREATSPTQAFDADQSSLAVYVYQRLAAEIVAQNKLFASQLKVHEARRTLTAGSGALGLSGVQFNIYEPKNSVYYYSRQADAQGNLDKLWRRGRDAVEQAFRKSSSPVYDPALADRFAQAVGPELDSLLTSWAKRKPEESYTLAWGLITNLRALKRHCDTILANAPAQRNFILNTLDAIADIITPQVQASANSV